MLSAITGTFTLLDVEPGSNTALIVVVSKSSPKIVVVLVTGILCYAYIN